MELTEETVRVLVAFIITNSIAIVGAIFAWVRAIKMIPKEVKGAELDNMGKEASVADKFNDIALKAAEQTVNLQAKLISIEVSYNMLKAAHDELAIRVVNQDMTMKEQARTIEAQTARLNQQGNKINEQEELIASLRSDLDATNAYASALVEQMKSANLVPLEAPVRRKTNGKHVGEKPVE